MQLSRLMSNIDPKQIFEASLLTLKSWVRFRAD